MHRSVRARETIDQEMIRGGSRDTLLHDYRMPLCSGTRELGASVRHVAHTPRLDTIAPHETRRVNWLKKNVRELAVADPSRRRPGKAYVQGVEQRREVCLAGELSDALGRSGTARETRGDRRGQLGNRTQQAVAAGKQHAALERTCFQHARERCPVSEHFAYAGQWTEPTRSGFMRRVRAQRINRNSGATQQTQRPERTEA